MKWILVVGALALVGAGCDWGKTPDYFPLSLGTNWEYQGKRQGQDLYEVDSVLGKDYMDDGKEVWILYKLATRAMKPTQDTVFVRKTDDGIWEYDFRSSKVGRKVLASPIEVGTTWQYQDPDSGQVTAQAMGVDDIVGAYATVKNCLRVKYKDADGDSWFAWFGPGVGPAGWQRPIGSAADSALLFRFAVVR